MTPVLFINCSRVPFLDLIMSRRKTFETRTRDTLRALVGQRVYLAETGNGRPTVRCSAVIRPPVVVCDRHTWDVMRKSTCVGVGSPYDWKPDTKAKYLYPISAVVPCDPFTPPDGTRHGRVWMEYLAEIK